MIALKVLHLLSLVAALGAGGARLILGQYLASTPDAAPALVPPMKRLATINYAGILGLWLTGAPLWLWLYGGRFDLGGGFHLKLLAVVILTALAGYAYLRTAQSRPLPMPVARRVGLATFASGVVAVIGAAWAFGA